MLNLYRGIAAAFYGHDPNLNVKDKVSVLARLKHDGVWLVDAVGDPINKKTTGARRAAIAAGLPELTRRIREVQPTLGVLICHGVVFSVVAPTLRSAGVPILHDEPLPFPLGNWRAQFVTGAQSSLANAGWFGAPATRHASGDPEAGRRPW